MITIDQREQHIEKPQVNVAPMHVPAVNAPWWTDLHGWGAIIGAIAALIVAVGGLYRYTHQRRTND